MTVAGATVWACPLCLRLLPNPWGRRGKAPGAEHKRLRHRGEVCAGAAVQVPVADRYEALCRPTWARDAGVAVGDVYQVRASRVEVVNVSTREITVRDLEPVGSPFYRMSRRAWKRLGAVKLEKPKPMEAI